MYLDKQNLFSEDQAVTETAVSTNVIDLGADDSKIQAFNEKDASVFAQVTKTFAGGTSLKATLQTSTTENFSSPITVQDSAVVATASLVAGYQFAFSKLPAGLKRYLRVNYTVVGTMSDGTVMAGLVFDKQSNGLL